MPVQSSIGVLSCVTAEWFLARFLCTAEAGRTVGIKIRESLGCLSGKIWSIQAIAIDVLLSYLVAAAEPVHAWVIVWRPSDLTRWCGLHAFAAKCLV